MRKIRLSSRLVAATITAATLALGLPSFGQESQSGTGAVESTPAGGNSVQDWTQWRGPNRDGSVKADWPGRLDESNLRQSWSVPMGPSYSGPIVAGDRVFVTETKDRKYEVVKALNRETGKEIWSQQWEGAMQVPFFANRNGSWIRSTPAYDDGRLYVAGMRDVLVCLDAESGKIIWQADLMKRFKSPLPQFGCVCSPMIDGDHVYIQAAGGFCKLDKNTGETVWRGFQDGGGMMGSAFSSPVIATLSGVRQAVIQARSEIVGIDLQTGGTLWSQQVPSFRGMNILTPTIYDNGIFLSTYGGTTQYLKVDRSEDGFRLTKTWEEGKQGNMSTPIVVDGHAYLNMKNKTIACFDLNQGGQKWASPRYGDYASLVTNGSKVLALDESGTLLLFNANPDKYELLDSRKVSEDSWAHLGVRGNQVFVRELNKMTVYEWTLPVSR